jgi:hypothetical protein
MNAEPDTIELDLSEVEVSPEISPVDGITHRENIERAEDPCIIIGYFWHDQDVENPCTSCDGVGMVHSLSHKHINNISYEKAKELLQDPMCVPLSYFEHGICLWDVQGGARWQSCPDKQWDGVEFAGVWVPDKCCRDEILHRYRKWKKEQGIRKTDLKTRQAKYHEIALVLAKQCTEEYTSWANGECYGYSVEKFNAEGNYVETLDQVGGYIGDYVKEELKSSFEHAIKHEKEHDTTTS